MSDFEVIKKLTTKYTKEAQSTQREIEFFLNFE